MFAPRASADSKDSRNKIPAPSPITNPSRSLSNGREAVVGSSFGDKAVSTSKPAIPISLIVASAPPAKQASNSPLRILTNASPIALVALAQAVTISKLIPRAPTFIEMFAAPIFPMVKGTNNGFTRFGPFSIMRWMPVWIANKPPIPDPTRTPTRSAFVSISYPLCAKASTLAATPN